MQLGQAMGVRMHINPRNPAAAAAYGSHTTACSFEKGLNPSYKG